MYLLHQLYVRDFSKKRDPWSSSSLSNTPYHLGYFVLLPPAGLKHYTVSCCVANIILTMFVFRPPRTTDSERKRSGGRYGGKGVPSQPPGFRPRCADSACAGSSGRR